MKRFICSILTLLLIVTMIPITALANTISIYEPVLSIDSMDIPSVDPGSSKSIQFYLKNSGGGAYDVTVTPVFEEPFTSNSLTNSISVGDVTGNKKVPVKLDVTTSTDAKPGNYPVKLMIKYNYYSENSSDSTGKVTKISGSHEEIIYIRVTGKSTLPKLLISKVSTNPEIISPGQNVELNILFENKGTLDAKDISIRLEGLNNKEGFYIGSGSDLGYVKRVPGNAVSGINFDLKAANNIKRGSHELEVVFKYGEFEEKQKIYLTVGGTGSYDSNLLIENLNYPTSAIVPNKNFELTFDLKNNSDSDAVNVIVRPESSDPAIVPKSTSIVKINSIPAGESESLTFLFSPTEDAISRNYPINIIVEYEDEFNQDEEYKHTVNQYVGMNVVNKSKDGDSTKGKPKLIIDKYSFEPQLVKAGENFKMNLSFYNTNSTKTVKNIKIFLTAEPGSNDSENKGNTSAFTPVDSSNTFYIDSIPPKGRVHKTITMFAIPDAIAKTHTITANFEYEDNDGNELKDIELIGVPVVQQSKLDVGEINFYPETFVGQSSPISLEFYNTGKVTLYNTMVKLEGDFQTENGQYYVGNFSSGSSDFFEGYVIPNEVGELDGAVVFTYEDSTGQKQEVRKEFSLNVMDMPMMEDDFGGEFPPMEEEQGGILKSKGFWGFIIAVIAIVAGIVIYRKRKKQKELSLDE